MRFSTRFINFALLTTIIATICVATSCKGRTMENMEPTGDTIEVVIIKDTIN